MESFSYVFAVCNTAGCMIRHEIMIESREIKNDKTMILTMVYFKYKYIIYATC